MTESGIMAKEEEAHTASSYNPPAFARQRSRPSEVRAVPFAGRIGGNQEFIATGEDEESEGIL